MNNISKKEMGQVVALFLEKLSQLQKTIDKNNPDTSLEAIFGLVERSFTQLGKDTQSSNKAVLERLISLEKGFTESIKNIPQPESQDPLIKELISAVKDQDSLISAINKIELPEINVPDYSKEIVALQESIDSMELSVDLEGVQDELIKLNEKFDNLDLSEFKLNEEQLEQLVGAMKRGGGKHYVGGGSSGQSINKAGAQINPATEDKQDDIITKLQEVIDSQGDIELHTDEISLDVDTLEENTRKTRYFTNEIFEDGTDTYFCKEDVEGNWYIMKIDASSVFTHATVENNSEVTTYASARTGVIGLTYGITSEAFNT